MYYFISGEKMYIGNIVAYCVTHIGYFILGVFLISAIVSGIIQRKHKIEMKKLYKKQLEESK